MNEIEQRKKALQFAQGERPKLTKKVAELGQAKVLAARALERARLNVYLAHATPDQADDAVAEASVRVAESDFEHVCTELDHAEEQLAALDRAEKTLVDEISRLEAAARVAHIEAAKEQLRARIAAASPAFAALVKDLATLRLLSNETFWPEEMHTALEAATGTPIRVTISAGQAHGDAIKIGAEA